jgi:hypothetical protein
MAFLLFAILILTSGRAPAQRDCCQGDWWLRWDQGQRETYFFGYATGYSQGLTDGCKRGDALTNNETSSAFPFTKCLQENTPDFSKNEDYYVSSITEFYNGHPEVRDINPYEVLYLLGKGLSVSQIRNYPFIRHNPSGTKP